MKHGRYAIISALICAFFFFPTLPSVATDTSAPPDVVDEAGAGTWIHDSIGWWWRRSADGTYPASQWLREGRAYYLFDSRGYMRTGWAKEEDTWYYLLSNGIAASGWAKDGGSWYYLDPDSHAMATGARNIEGTWYHFAPSGAMEAGWVHQEDGWHYYASSGAQMGGWIKDGGEWYYLDPVTGIMRTDTLVSGGRAYEFAPSGAWQGYEAPAGMLQPTDHITPVEGATNTLTWGMNGVKVRVVQRRLGLWHTTTLASVDAQFVAAVKNFQRRAGLAITGVVDETTWNALNTGQEWTMDQYQVEPLALTATRSQRIEAMIGYAWNQIGSSYTWGGAGPYDAGYDCSGLVLQALYRAGMDPQPINVIHHAWPTYRTSQELYKYPRFQHVPLSERQRGDLIFYRTGNEITHVSIYIGDNRVVHTDWMGRPARMDSITAGYGWDRMVTDVVRPLP